MSPYNPFVAQYDTNAINKHQGHGKFIHTQNDEWFITLLTQRRDESMKEKSYNKKGFSQLGRETSLYPVTWKDDGWPFVSDTLSLSDVQPFPNLPYTPLTNNYSDDFNSDELGLQWLNVRNPIYDDRLLNERKGWLRLYTGEYTLDDIQARNILVQRETSKNYSASIKMDFYPETIEQAGLVCYYDTKSYISFSLRNDRNNGYKIVLEEKNGRGKSKNIIAETVDILSNSIYLKVAVNNLNRDFYYSYDGSSWLLAGSINGAYYLSDEGTPEWGFMGTMVGIYSLNYGSGKRLKADFDEFILENY